MREKSPKRARRERLEQRVRRIRAKLDLLHELKGPSRWYRPSLRDLERLVTIAIPPTRCERSGCRRPPRRGRRRCGYHGAWARELTLDDEEFLFKFEDKIDLKLERAERANTTCAKKTPS